MLTTYFALSYSIGVASFIYALILRFAADERHLGRFNAWPPASRSSTRICPFFKTVSMAMVLLGASPFGAKGSISLPAV